MYPMNPEASYRLFQLEHEHRIKQVGHTGSDIRQPLTASFNRPS